MSYHLLGMGDGEIGPPADELEVYGEPAPSMCPDCSYFDGGTCKWCPDNADIPGCGGCVDHRRQPEPWYKRSDVLVPMGIAVVTAVLAAIVTQVTMNRMRIRAGG